MLNTRKENIPIFILEKDENWKPKKKPKKLLPDTCIYKYNMNPHAVFVR